MCALAVALQKFSCCWFIKLQVEETSLNSKPLLLRGGGLLFFTKNLVITSFAKTLQRGYVVFNGWICIKVPPKPFFCFAFPPNLAGVWNEIHAWHQYQCDQRHLSMSLSVKVVNSAWFHPQAIIYTIYQPQTKQSKFCFAHKMLAISGYQVRPPQEFSQSIWYCLHDLFPGSNGIKMELTRRTVLQELKIRQNSEVSIVWKQRMSNFWFEDLRCPLLTRRYD